MAVSFNAGRLEHVFAGQLRVNRFTTYIFVQPALLPAFISHVLRKLCLLSQLLLGQRLFYGPRPCVGPAHVWVLSRARFRLPSPFMVIFGL